MTLSGLALLILVCVLHGRVTIQVYHSLAFPEVFKGIIEPDEAGRTFKYIWLVRKCKWLGGPGTQQVTSGVRGDLLEL